MMIIMYLLLYADPHHFLYLSPTFIHGMFSPRMLPSWILSWSPKIVSANNNNCVCVCVLWKNFFCIIHHADFNTQWALRIWTTTISHWTINHGKILWVYLIQSQRSLRKKNSLCFCSNLIVLIIIFLNHIYLEFSWYEANSNRFRTLNGA